MARINTYATDNNITAQDKWIGTDFNGNVTKNFTPEGVANWINSTNSVGIAGQSNFKFQTDLGTGRQNGTISFDAGSGDGTLFSTVNDIKISKYGADGNLILDFLQNLVGTFILLCQVDDTNNFGVYRLDSLTQDEVETDFYTAVLTVYGSNGTLQTDEYYGVVAYPGSSIVSVTGLEAIDEGNGVGWRLIGRDPDNYGNIGLNAVDFSNSDSVSTERGSTGENSITFGNNNINQQSGSIVLGGNQSVKITDTFQGANIITGFDNFIWGATYSSLIAAYRSTIGVEGTNYTTNALYQSLIVGDGHNYYAGRDSGVVGGGLISGSTGCFTVGIANEDLTTTTSNWLTAQYNNYGPRFIVGCGTYTPTTGVAGVRQNGFVVMSDGTATFPIGNVGIGTTSPGVKLDVQGTVLVNNEIRFVDSSMRIFRSSNDMRLRTGNSDRMTIDSLGNVGIGTTSPSAALEVNGGIKLSDNQYLSWATSNTRMVGQLGYLQFQVAAADVMRMTSGGNVGIGTTSPSEKLEVAGNIKATGGVYVGGSNSFLWNNEVGSNLRFGANGSEKARITSNGNFGIGTTNPATRLEVVGGASGYLMRVRGTNTFNVYDPGSSSIGLGSGSGQELKLFSNDSLNNGITISTSGNIGIGTTSPSAKLHVVGDILANNYWVPSGSNAYYMNYNSTAGMYIDSTHFITLNAGGNEGIRIESIFGNVGIGTTSPSEKLDVDGNIKLGATTGRQLMFGENKYGAIRLGNNTVIGGNQAVDIRTGNASVSSQSSRVFINQTGFVGVGTTTPIATLDVNGPIKMGNATTTPQASTVGTMRYRADSNNSYVEMIMQTGPNVADYAWVIIKQNTW